MIKVKKFQWIKNHNEVWNDKAIITLNIIEIINKIQNNKYKHNWRNKNIKKYGGKKCDLSNFK